MVAFPTSHKPTLEILLIGSKPFQLFPLEKTLKRFSDVGKTYIYDRKILLDTNSVLPLLPIRLYAGATHMSRSNAISPYTDDEREDIDYTSAPLSLDASIHNAVLRNIKLTEQMQPFPAPCYPK